MAASNLSARESSSKDDKTCIDNLVALTIVVISMPNSLERNDRACHNKSLGFASNSLL